MGLKDLLTKYENAGNGGNFDSKFKWFFLKDDGDTAVVRFLLSDENDILKFTKEIHKVKINGYENKVLCLGDKCEICKNNDEHPSLRIWIPLYNADKDELQMWERGLNDIKELMNLIEEYGGLDERDYKVKRNGKAKSNKTTYSYFPKDKEERAKLDEYKEEIPNIVGRDYKYVLDLTAEQQIEAMNTGEVTWKKNDEENTNSNSNTDGGEEVF